MSVRAPEPSRRRSSRDLDELLTRYQEGVARVAELLTYEERRRAWQELEPIRKGIAWRFAGGHGAHDSAH